MCLTVPQGSHVAHNVMTIVVFPRIMISGLVRFELFSDNLMKTMTLLDNCT